MVQKLSQEYARLFALYNGLLEQIESEFEHLEPAWNPEGSWYPDGFRSNDGYKPGKRFDQLCFWLKQSHLEAYYENEDAFFTVSFDYKTWTEEEIQQRENNPLLAYYEPFLGEEQLAYLVEELNFNWGLERPE